MRIRPKTHRLVFFALETILLTLSSLAVAGKILRREIDEPRVRLLFGSLFIVSFFGLPIWCALYHARERGLELLAGVTLIGLVVLWLLSAFF